MRMPPALQPGDKVMLLATARRVTPQEMAPAIRSLREWGLEVIESPNLYQADHQFSGTDTQRLADLQQAMDDLTVRMILCARGGYGTLRILDGIDFKGIKRNPKWLVGFSDLTALHVALWNEGIASIHGPMAVSWNGKTANESAIDSLRKLIFGESVSYAAPAQRPDLTRTGTAEGRLIGGNLSILSQLLGTPTDFDTRGSILFLEDLDEYRYHIDRMMVHLQRGGKLSKLSGLIVGGFTDIKDNETPFGKSAEEIIFEKVAGFDFPVCFGFPTGHWPENQPLIQGARARLNVSHTGTELTFLPG